MSNANITAGFRHYQLLNGSNGLTLAKLVNTALADGWVLFGVTFYVTGQGFYQAVVCSLNPGRI